MAVLIAILVGPALRRNTRSFHGIQLHGMVITVQKAGRLTLLVDRARQIPAGSTSFFKRSRRKQVQPGPSTLFVDDQGRPLSPALVRPGSYVDVAGPDEGIGSVLRPQIIALDSRASVWLDLTRMLVKGGSAPDSSVAAIASTPAAEPDVIPTRFRGAIIDLPPRGFSDRIIALTFDDGPSPERTPFILRTLAKYGVTATFCVLGCCAVDNPNLVRDEARQGCYLVSHSYSHPAKTTEARGHYEVDHSIDIIQSLSGQRVRMFRPPYGIIKGVMAHYARKLGYTVLLWSVDTRDWELGKTPAGVVKSALDGAGPGSIILMHDGTGHSTVAALPSIIESLQREGYSFVTLPKMLQAWDRFMTEKEKQKALARARIARNKTRRAAALHHAGLS